MSDNSFHGSSIAAIRAGPEWVRRVDTVHLSVGDALWSYARDHAAAIDAHWQRRQAENPAMFNGVILVLDAFSMCGGVLRGRLVRTDFKSYLHWRDASFPEAGVLDAFGSALIRCADGHIVLGRQRAGHVNAGLAYLPGGFIDQRDIAADGTVDIGASIQRELAEESGLHAGDFTVAPGYILTRHGALLALAQEVLVPLPADAVRARILAHIAADPDPELADAVIVRSAADIDPASTHGYARQLLVWVFAEV